jgi:transcriptional regulator GlxA family with amidase domain
MAVKTSRVVIVAAPGGQILDVVGPFQVFARATELFAKGHPQRPAIYSLQVVATSRQKALLTSCGLQLMAHDTFRRVRGRIDTLLIAGGGGVEDESTGVEFVDWVRRVAPQCRRVGSICTGAMLLAQAGLLDGRRATTHWQWCERLAKKYPKILVDADPIFIRDGSIYTSAGVTAGMDLALALVEEDHGSRLALDVARELVLYLRRPGGQSQFSAALSMQLSERMPFRELEAWVMKNLHKPLSVQMLADRVSMSTRNFSRIFMQEMQVTPARFIERLRFEAARRRLEESQHSLKKIAAGCGFSGANAMRSVFQRILQVAPGEYRHRFRGSGVGDRL